MKIPEIPIAIKHKWLFKVKKICCEYFQDVTTNTNGIALPV